MSFTTETRERTRPALPLAAMVDVLFLLLIFFMTASVFRQQELQIEVQLPTAETAEAGGPIADRLVITVDDDDAIYLGPRELTVPELREKLRELAESNPNQTIVIRGDQRSRHGRTMQVLDLAREAGFTTADFGTVRSADDLQ
ncbi:MAG: ExbD/TolR family protein [Phycisphaeraceae bacterium]